MNITLTIEDQVGTMGTGEKCYVFRSEGRVIGKCNTTDNPDSPVFWFAEDEELSFLQQQRLADAFMFVQRL